MAISVYKIPLDGFPQGFLINLAGIDYNLIVKWNNASDGGWILDIQDANNVPIVCNIPFITGTDLLNGLNYLGINGQLWVTTDQDKTAVPTFDNLGTDSNLYFQTDVANG